MSYFHEKILEIIKEVKSPHHAADEIISMLEAEGVLDSEDDEDIEEYESGPVNGGIDQECD